MFHLCRSFSTGSISRAVVKSSSMVRILNVAEKNDAAKSIADIMSRGAFRKREGLSRFNKIYECEYQILNQQATMSMTSVSGHLLTFEFVGQYRKWNGCSPVALFDAPVQKMCPENFNDIKRTLEREIRGCPILIIWTDCDREGENIGFEVIQVCLQVKPNIRVYRARFSEITPQAIARATANLVEADKNTSDAVDVRQELDLRIGAAFTRFQTLRLKKVFPDVLAEQLISYGSCQFPTLGFVVERYKQVQAFIPEPFWKIKVSHEHEDGHVEFAWKRQRLFDHLACSVIYEHCLEDSSAHVMDVKSKPKSKWRPCALETVELEKLASRKLHINAKETMKIAEKLYTQGYISYPRTETNIFPKDLNLMNLVQQQTGDPQWGEFAQRVAQRGPTPRNGNKSDQAHPPIHPTKYTNNLQGNEKRLYEFIVRHFLACCSQDAQGQETIVDIEINNEKFSASGLMIIAKNYLDVYPYDKWNAKIIPTYQPEEVFQPSVLEMVDGETSAPPLLTEADLIALMDKHGIGTDATHADHIETIKSRMYVGVRPDGRFVPGELGMGLVEGYDAMGFEMSKPHLRAELEADLKRICDGVKDKNVVLAEQIQKYRTVFEEAANQANKIDEALSEYFGTAQPYTAETYQSVSPAGPCPKCGCDMTVKEKKDGKGFYLSCQGYPACREAVWFPEFVLSAAVSDNACPTCPGPKKKIKFKFKRGSVPMYLPLEYEGCIGCDDMLKEVIQVSGFSGNRTNNTNSQGSQPSMRGSGATRPSQPNRSYSTMTQAQPRGRAPLAQQQNNRHGPGMMRPVRPPTSQGRNHRDNSCNPQGMGRGSAWGERTDGRTSGPTSNGTDDTAAGTVVCNCGDDARLLTVRKEGPNTGRQFYGCPKPPDAKCGFFLWADQSADNTNSGNTTANGGGWNNNNRTQRGGGTAWNNNRTATQHQGADNDDDADVKCQCGIEARRLTVQKEGPNKGRPFYGCPKPRDQGCGFFQWGDEPGGGTGGGFRGRGGGGFGAASRGRGSGSATRGARSGGENTGVKRKRHCGICGEEGHTRKKCPSA